MTFAPKIHKKLLNVSVVLLLAGSLAIPNSRAQETNKTEQQKKEKKTRASAPGVVKPPKEVQNQANSRPQETNRPERQKKERKTDAPPPIVARPAKEVPSQANSGAQETNKPERPKKEKKTDASAPVAAKQVKEVPNQATDKQSTVVYPDPERKLFHNAVCSLAPRDAVPMSRVEAIRQGMKPCRQCKPQAPRRL